MCGLRKIRKEEVREVSRSPTLGKWSSTPGSISGKYIGRRGSDSPTTTVLFPGLSSKHILSDKLQSDSHPKRFLIVANRSLSIDLVSWSTSAKMRSERILLIFTKHLDSELAM